MKKGEIKMYNVAIEKSADYSWENVNKALDKICIDLGFDIKNPFSGFIKEGMTVFIKPNWVASRWRESCPHKDTIYSVITHPSIIEAVADRVALALNGNGKIIIGDNPSIDADFEELMNFVYYDFAKENQFIQLHIDGEEYVYQIFSVNFLKPFDVNNFARNGYEKEDMKEFLNVLNKGNLYDHNIDVNEDDKFISLYTCTKFYGKEINSNLVVTGRLLRKGEKIKLSTIEKTEKYDEIADIMKGGEENE
jgi:hypothetical protein